jgi:hypothetical protein
MFLFSTASRQALGPTQPPIQRPEREADDSLSSNAEVKNAWSYTSTLSRVIMAWYLVEQRYNLYLAHPLHWTVCLFVCLFACLLVCLYRAGVAHYRSDTLVQVFKKQSVDIREFLPVTEYEDPPPSERTDHFRPQSVAHIITTYISRIHFNIILISMYRRMYDSTTFTTKLFMSYLCSPLPTSLHIYIYLCTETVVNIDAN